MTDDFLIKYTDAETSVVPCIPGTGDSSQRKFMVFHKLSQKYIYLGWLDFFATYTLYVYKRTHILSFLFFHFGNIKIYDFCWK